MPMVGRIIVSSSDQAVGLHLQQWQTQPSATLSFDETRRLIRELQAQLPESKQAKAAPAKAAPKADTPKKITLNGKPIGEDDDFSDIA